MQVILGSNGTSFQWQGDYDASPGVGGASRYSQYDVVRINANHSSITASQSDLAQAVDGNLYIVNAVAPDGAEYPWTSPNSTWQLFLEASSGGSDGSNNTSINWKGDYDASMDVGGVFRYYKNDLVRINPSHHSISADHGVSALATEGNLYMVTTDFADGVEQPWDSPNGTWMLFAEAPTSITNVHIQNANYFSENDSGGTHSIGSNDNTPKFEMWYTETNNKVSLKGRFNFGQATQFSSPAQINLNPGYRTVFQLNSEFPDGKKLPFADHKSTASGFEYKYLGKAYSLKYDFGSMVWERTDFTCMVSSSDGLMIMNTTNQTINLTTDFYFEIEYDSLSM